MKQRKYYEDEIRIRIKKTLSGQTSGDEEEELPEKKLHGRPKGSTKGKRKTPPEVKIANASLYQEKVNSPMLYATDDHLEYLLDHNQENIPEVNPAIQDHHRILHPKREDEVPGETRDDEQIIETHRPITTLKLL